MQKYKGFDPTYVLIDKANNAKRMTAMQQYFGIKKRD